MQDEKPQGAKETQIQISLDEEVAQGIYCNLAIINHSQSEFTLDFVYVQPQQPKAKVRSRVIMSPFHFRRLISALEENLSKFESKFGTVVQIESPNNPSIH